MTEKYRRNQTLASKDTTPEIDKLHNILGTTQENFLSLVAQISAKQAEADRTAAAHAHSKKQLKKARKLLEAEGIPLGDFDMVVRLIDLGPEILAESFGRMGAMAHAMGGAPVGYQFDMFSEAKKVTPDMKETAEAAGTLAGVRGVDQSENPYSVGSEQHNFWLGAHTDAYKLYVAAGKTDIPDEPKRPRGRPKKEEAPEAAKVGPKDAEVGGKAEKPKAKDETKEPVEDDAFWEGVEAAKASADKTLNPHKPGTVARGHWNRGYDSVGGE